MFHVELRQFPHVARAFNLAPDELQTRFVAPWLAGTVVDWGDRRWAPERTKLTVLEGPELRTDEIGLGRGWSNAARVSEDVTERLLREGVRGGDPEFDQFKQEILVLATAERLQLCQAAALAGAFAPGRRVSEQLAFSERAVWELLHEGRISMARDPDGTLGRDQWQPVLLAWPSWRDEAVFIEAAGAS